MPILEPLLIFAEFADIIVILAILLVLFQNVQKVWIMPSVAVYSDIPETPITDL